MGVAQKTSEFKAAVKNGIETTLGEGGSIDVKHLQESAGKMAHTALSRIEQFCKERPLTAVGIGLVVGALIAGRLFKKAD